MPAGPINSVNQALEDPQIAARGMLIDAPRVDGKVFQGLRTPIRFSDADLAAPVGAPLKGQDDAIVTGFRKSNDLAG